MEPIRAFRGKAVALPASNVDTDQITPAKLTMVTDRLGLGRILFAHWRYRDTQAWVPNPDFPLNRPGAQGATVLVAGDNFGCGSSREHAPWALTGYGFRALVSTSFADIFRGNALKNGLLPIVVDGPTHAQALAAAERNETFEVDLEEQTLSWPGGRRVPFAIDAFSKRCLLLGVDELGYTLGHAAAIDAFEHARG